MTLYYPLYVFRIGSDEVPKKSPRAIKKDFRSLGQLVKGSGAWVVFSFIFPVPGNNTERNRQTQFINM